jgi:hypothetical protein
MRGSPLEYASSPSCDKRPSRRLSLVEDISFIAIAEPSFALAKRTTVVVHGFQGFDSS